MGFGKAIVSKFVAEGAQVLVLDIMEPSPVEAISSIPPARVVPVLDQIRCGTEQARASQYRKHHLTSIMIMLFVRDGKWLI